MEGYGDACDADCDNDALKDVNLLDFGVFWAALTGSPITVTDHDGDGDIDLLYSGSFIGQLQGGVTSGARERTNLDADRATGQNDLDLFATAHEPHLDGRSRLPLER